MGCNAVTNVALHSEKGERSMSDFQHVVEQLKCILLQKFWMQSMQYLV
jgi:hypothetical protein